MATNDSRRHVVIIGAGVGGTTLAARLGKLGHRVTVLEKNETSGGRCSLLKHGGHRWDVGPSLYLMPELFAEAFASLGHNINDHLDLVLCSPAYTIHFSPAGVTADGEKGSVPANGDAKPSVGDPLRTAADPHKKLTLSSDLAIMGPQLDALERPYGNKDPLGSFLNFLGEAGTHYEESVEHVLKKDWSVPLWQLATRWELYPMLWRTSVLHVWTNLYRRACHHFKSPQIRQAATFSSMYMGMSPFHAPATYSLLQYAEYAKGIHYPIGGFHAVVAALEKIAREDFGVDFRYGSEKGAVKRIVVDESKGDGWVRGVELENGEVIEADLVVSNADLVWTYNNLLPPSKYARNLRSLAQTCSSISFYWGLSKPLPQLTAHNIFLAPSEVYSSSFDDIFQRGQLPTEASFYVNVPSKLDPQAAPEGKETLVILVPCGPIEQSREEGLEIQGAARTRDAFRPVRERARQQVLDTMEARLGMERGELEKLIEQEYVNEPLDWAERYNLWRGSILGLSHTLLQVLCLRPSIKHAKYRNLYFVGASTQPGTGVPVVVAGSEVVAKRVDRFLRALDAGKTSDDPISTLALLSVLVAVASAVVLVLGLVGWDVSELGRRVMPWP
ncbi:hypothetical protein CF327_g688 [Tilletia walkeri]|uniref:Phytoene desaturase n=1 Tax=Tilletia walkeri TaxID=117179 RepID=A0A8X7NF77_9BASI|nr:hypothetical protein CF327_g688 [Tilletia walkeri]KAE8271200.1 hypothetical protein A4X09_0g1168 [Tilletia walkeri]